MPVIYRRDIADWYCNFFEQVLRHTSDEYYGKPFFLTPWEKDFICRVFGFVDEASGNRMVREAHLELPKKTGKTEFCAGLILAQMVRAKHRGFQVYGTAAAQRQAANVYRAACSMVEQSPLLKSLFVLRRSTYRILKRDDYDTFYVAVAADGDFTDGVNPAVVVADEIHRYRTRKMLENWDVLAQGGLAREQALTISITTAGVRDESPLAWRLHERTRKIQSGVFEDPTFYGRIYGAEEGDDWSDESTWIKANPSLKENGGFIDIDVYRKKYQAALGDAEQQVTFQRYLLNMWNQKARRAVPMEQWHKCKATFTAEPLGPLGRDDVVRPLSKAVTKHFLERKVWVGVDLSISTDMSAVVCISPSSDGGYDVLPFYYMPADGLRKKELRDGVPYTKWQREGWLETHEGNAIDYGRVKERILWTSRMFDVQEVCFDRYNSREMSINLIDKHGLNCCEIPQTFGGLSEAFKRVLACIATGTLHHGGHPILEWNASCVDTKDDGNDNIKPIKPTRAKDTSRIDGFTAMLNAIARAMVSTEKRSEWSGEAVVI